MQLFIVAVGKARGSAEHVLAEDWLGRLPDGGNIHEIESKLPAGAKRTDDEGVRLLRAVPAGAAFAILDPRGKDHSSEDLAALIRAWRDSGYGSAALMHPFFWELLVVKWWSNDIRRNQFERRII